MPAAAFLLVIWLIPHRFCSMGADRWFEGDVATQRRLATGVATWVRGGVSTDSFTTGSIRFDGEWVFGTWMMAGLGLTQMVIEHPELRDTHLPLINACIANILSDQGKAFDTAAWNEDPILAIDRDTGHAAYLGYLNLLLSAVRVIDPTTEHTALNDRITAALVRRLNASPTLLIETYPGETYPVDNCAVIASIGLHGRATERDRSTLVRRWIDRCRRDYVDPESGLLIQAVDTGGKAVDGPRGSGTCLGLYFLSFTGDELSADLYLAVKRELAGKFLGFGTVREYPRSVWFGRLDIDSGPIVFGYGVSATGFALGGARIHGDRDYFSRTYGTAVLFGAPLTRGDTLTFVSGGPLGDAILLAMLTAQPPSRWHEAASATARGVHER